jgi:hypothetical protein
MDAFEITKILLGQIETRQESKTPVISKSIPAGEGINRAINSRYAFESKNQPSFPWTEFVIISGAIIILIIVLKGKQKDHSYDDSLKKKKNRLSIFK